jgi:hypothetical protein
LIGKIHLRLMSFRFAGSDISSKLSFSIIDRYSSSIAGSRRPTVLPF